MGRKRNSDVERESSPRAQMAISLKITGMTYEQVAAVMGISRQRVLQLIKPRHSVQTAVKIRARFCCEECREPIEGGHVHHVDSRLPYPEYNAINNLEYLCAGCHRRKHWDEFRDGEASGYGYEAVT
jgi:hypothetical protein